MRVNSTIVAILVFLSLGPAVAAPAEAPKGFRQLTWGASPNKHLMEAPGPAARGITLYRPRPGKKPLPRLFNVPVAEEVYSFLEGKFFSASVRLDGKDNHEKILAALIEKFGQPSEVVNNYDRHFQPNKRKNLRIWKWPDSPVEIRLGHDEVYFRTTVTYLNSAVKSPEAPDSTESNTASNADK